MWEIHFPVVHIPYRSSHFVASCLTAFSVGSKDWATGHGESCDIEVYISSGIAFSRLFTSETHQILHYCESPHLGLITRGPLLASVSNKLISSWDVIFFPQAVEGNEWVFLPALMVLKLSQENAEEIILSNQATENKPKALRFFKGQVTDWSYFPERYIHCLWLSNTGTSAFSKKSPQTCHLVRDLYRLWCAKFVPKMIQVAKQTCLL